MTNAFFYKTTVQTLDRTICDLAAGYWDQRRSLFVWTPDEATSKRLDQMLWTWRQDSFVVHLSLDNLGPEEKILVESTPIIIGSRLDDRAKLCKSVLLHSPRPVEQLQSFEEVLDFVIDDNENAKTEARSRFRSYREAGLEPQLMP